MEERWKDIEDYEGMYQISDHGRVKSLHRVVTMKNGFNKSIKTKILKGGINYEGGYDFVCLTKKCIHTQLYKHRLVAIYFIDNPENKAQVNHIDGNKQNNHYTNIEWSTPRENQLHAHATGLKPNMKFGENTGGAKLTEKEVLEIVDKLQNTKLTQRDIANGYNIDSSMISRINSGTKWGYLKLDYPIRPLK